MHKLEVIDSHTEGEATRVVVSGAPDLGTGSAAERLARLREQHDELRSTVCNEPRGFDALVGALLLPPLRADSVAQVVFFNNVGYLGMCVHGAIGVTRTLQHLGRIGLGRHRIETPVGDVFAELSADGSIAVENVESFRHARRVAVETSRGVVHGDISWGGNWFFLVEDHCQELLLERVAALTDYACDVRAGLERAQIRGFEGAVIDHIELFGPPTRPDAHSKNFVLCPGREYDRSPCGTGTSAKLACLVADKKLAPGDVWRQESILGTLFTGRIQLSARGVIPTVAGRAWITAESTLLCQSDDPFRAGIRK